MTDDEERPKPTPQLVGEDLATLSEAELATRIAALEVEIRRIETELEAKRASREAVASIFKS